ncbi:MAG: fumarate hydratase [Ruminococcus sp.]|jgi:fumarate hydratase subunit alpha|nr:fumarate hydratase [Ruminococcus sp.]
MREIKSKLIQNAVRDLCIEANIYLPDTLRERIKTCAACERNALGKEILCDLTENFTVAETEKIPICQDTGMAIIFLEIGQDVHITGDTPKTAVNKGVAAGYTEGYLRCSVVRDPLDRVNTEDNTPAIVYTEIVPGDRVKITAAPKGFGSENMSRQKMFLPSNSIADIEDFVVETVKIAGSNPCPPMVVGVGIGGDFEYAAFLAKKALCRDIAIANPNPFYEAAEKRLLTKINETGIGPQGFGGDTTALAVMIETFPTHIAGLPVAVNIGCHVTRHAEKVI